tara:strand:- start:5805 stop:6578 length:774 start_codon:yes stop_codon:yes gene_type:complete
MLIRIILVITLFFAQSCSLFKKDDLSSADKFDLGVEYFSKKKFQKAKDKFEFLVQNEQGTNIGLESTLYLAKSLFELEEYDEASYNFNYYSMFSKNIKNVEYSQFMKCRCAFELTLPYSKDQSNSFFAISVIQEFLDNFPSTIYKEDAYDMLSKLRNRLSKKYYESARLYLKMGEFESAFYYFDIIILEYYDTYHFDQALISYIFTYIVMGDYDKALDYFELNNKKFIDIKNRDEAEQILIDYKNRLGFSGLYRLYK